MSALRAEVADLWSRYEAGDLTDETRAARETVEALLDGLEAGTVRAAERRGGEWVGNDWVKRGVLLAFALRSPTPRDHGGVRYHDVLPLADTGAYGDRGTRNTPDGTVVRRGASVGRDCILMSPCFVNVGARVGDETLVDSCDTVGSCAQVGAGVKLGANTVLGGVLEPVEAAPVVVEDGASLGAGCRVTSGFVVGRDCVVAENTLLSPRIPVYDLADGEVRHGRLPPERRAVARHVPAGGGDDLVPEGAVKPAVVATALDDDTRAAVEREEALR